MSQSQFEIFSFDLNKVLLITFDDENEFAKCCWTTKGLSTAEMSTLDWKQFPFWRTAKKLILVSNLVSKCL